MRSKRHSLTARAALGMCTMVLLAGSASAATETVIHPFNPGGWDGSGSQANMISDAQGNLYGTNFYGGRNGVGTVFELSPNGNGGWTEKVLHDFRFDGEDGNGPSASLIMDAAGNLYGTTTGGGLATSARSSSCRPTPMAAGLKRNCITSVLTAMTEFIRPAASSLMQGAICTARLVKVAITVAERCSSWRPTVGVAGRKGSCTTFQAWGLVGIAKSVALWSIAPAISMEPPVKEVTTSTGQPSN